MNIIRRCVGMSWTIRNTKGKTSTDIAEEYYDSANEVSERISYPDDDSANYANQIASALNSEISVTNLTEQGDSNVDDGEIKRLGYEQQEKNLVQQAQKLMISYYSGKASWPSRGRGDTGGDRLHTGADEKSRWDGTPVRSRHGGGGGHKRESIPAVGKRAVSSRQNSSSSS